MDTQNFDYKNVGEEKSLTKERGQNFFTEVFRFALVALLVVIPIRIFIAQPFLVSGSSMIPTFENGDYLIVDEITYRFNEPKRGEVIIFRLPSNNKKFLIKRIIGLPNETVNIIKGEVFIQKENESSPGTKIEEDYLTAISFEDSSLTLGENEYFVMGDNRKASFDGRSWGALNKDLIKGRALLRLMPINKISIFPGFVK